MNRRLVLLLLCLGWTAPAAARDRLPTIGRCSPSHENEFVRILVDKGDAILLSGELEAAETQYRNTLAMISRRGLGGIHKVRSAVGLARALDAQGKTDEAVQELDALSHLGHHCISEELALVLFEQEPDRALNILAETQESSRAPASERGRLQLLYADLMNQSDPVQAAVSLNENPYFVPEYLVNAPDSELALLLHLAEVLWAGRWDRESVGSGSIVDDPFEPDRMLRWVVEFASPELQKQAVSNQLEIRIVREIEEKSGAIPGWNLGGEFEQADQVRQLIDEADLVIAFDGASRLVEQRPGAESLGLLGDVYWSEGKGDLAHQLYEQAAAWELVPGEWHDRWLMGAFSEETTVTDPKIIRGLERASLGVDPNPEMLILLARAYRSAGREDEARERYEQAAEALRSLPDAVASSRLADVEVELSGLESNGSQALIETRRPAIDPAWEASISALRVALSMAAAGEQDLARRAFERARRLAPEVERLYAAQGAIAWFSGDVQGTIKAWKKSLRWDPSQRSLWLGLGKVYLSQGDLDGAREALGNAGTGGLSDGWVLLALLEYGQGEEDKALEYLQRFDEGPRGRSDYEQDADALARALAPVLGGNVAASVQQNWILGIGAVALVLFVVWWRARRSDIHALLEDFPESSHDLARILSAIRHEVLKHNTTLLDEVADALDHGDHHAVSFAAIRLFGMPDSADGGIPQRFEGYIRALERVGRRFRRRLDIRGDPILGPMIESMSKLRDLEPSLRRPWRASAKVPDRLRDLSTDLNETAYRAIGSLLSSMGTLSLDKAFIEGVNERVLAEPGLSELDLPDLEVQITDTPLLLRIFHGDLQDILANLLRNAWSAGMESGAPGVGVRVEEEEDPITGLEHVAIRVLDRASGRLRTDQITSRGIGRGLGLSADLVARHDGHLEVESRADELEQGWTKAVVLRLRRVEVE